MATKIFISDYTHRTEAEQLKTLYEDDELKNAPIFRPQDLSFLFRKTRRVEQGYLHVASVSCLAPNKAKLLEFLSECKKRNNAIIGKEEQFFWTTDQPIRPVVDAWKLARIEGAAKIGGKRTAERWKAKMENGIEKARPLWPLPSSEYSIAAIEKISGISRGAIVRVLGNRFPAQYNYQAAQKRKERRNAKQN